MNEGKADAPAGLPPEDPDALRERNQKLILMVNELSTRYAALNFKAYEMSEEIRTLEMRLSGTQAAHRCIEWENSQLRTEIQLLRKVLLEFSDPPPEIRQLIESYRYEMALRGERPDREKSIPVKGECR